MEVTKKRIVIGIQARSTSKRLPGKVFANLGPSTVLGSVINACASAMTYINSNESRRGYHCTFALLVPYGDAIIEQFRAKFFEGPEDDVLTRYKMMSDKIMPDYIVRVTADCPMIPSPSISKLIKMAVKNEYDYVANFFETKGDRKLIRLVPDGFDCEVFSRRMLDWCDKEATEMSDREHVTTLMRTYPEWGKYGVVLPYLDSSDKKISVDTVTDLENVRKEYSTLDEAKQLAIKMFGPNAVHRY